MLTRNFWTVLAPIISRLKGSTKTVTLVSVDETTITGTSFSATSSPYNLLGAMCIPYANTSYGSRAGTWFGTGRTPATSEDYKMEAPITDGSLTIISGDSALACAVNGDHVRISAAHQVTNSTNEDIAISEIGCFGAFSGSGPSFLMDHTVLEEPITIPAKDTITLEYTIKFPFGN